MLPEISPSNLSSEDAWKRSLLDRLPKDEDDLISGIFNTYTPLRGKGVGPTSLELAVGLVRVSNDTSYSTSVGHLGNFPCDEPCYICHGKYSIHYQEKYTRNLKDMVSSSVSRRAVGSCLCESPCLISEGKYSTSNFCLCYGISTDGSHQDKDDGLDGGD